MKIILKIEKGDKVIIIVESEKKEKEQNPYDNFSFSNK